MTDDQQDGDQQEDDQDVPVDAPPEIVCSGGLSLPPMGAGNRE